MKIIMFDDEIEIQKISPFTLETEISAEFVFASAALQAVMNLKFLLKKKLFEGD